MTIVLSTAALTAALSGQGIWTLTDRVSHAHPVSGGEGGFGQTVQVHGDAAAVGAPNLESVFVYERRAGTWHEEARLGGPSGFGKALELDDDRLLVGAPGNQSIHAYSHTNEGWTVADEMDGPESFGQSLSMSGESVAVAAPDEESVHVLSWTESALLEEQILTGGADFGSSVEIGETNLFVVSPGDGIHRYTESAGSWTQAETIDGSFPFDTDLGLDGDILVAGSGLQNTAKIVEPEDGSWTVAAELSAGDVSPAGSSEWFGSSVDVSQGVVLVGAPEDDPLPGLVSVSEEKPPCVSAGGIGACPPPTPGTAYVFEKQAEGWSQVQKLTPTDAGYHDAMGTSVALDEAGATALVGAPMDRLFVWPVSVDAEDAVYTFDDVSAVEGEA